MPLYPPFDETDPQSWSQNNRPLRITVHPYAPPRASTGNAAAADGIDDWFVAGNAAGQAPFPDDWFVPGNGRSDASYPDDWFVPSFNGSNSQTAPNLQSAPATTENGNTFASPSNNSPAARPDPLAAYWSLIPASRAGAMAWHPPIFLPPNPFAPENIPASAWVTPPPIFPRSSGQFPSTVPQPLDARPTAAAQGSLGGLTRLLAASARSDVPGIGAGHDLLGATARLPVASASSDVPAISAGYDLLGAIARLPSASTLPGVPAIGVGQNPLAPSLGAQPNPRFRSALLSGPPFEAGSSVGDRYAQRSLLGSQAGLSPAPSSLSATALASTRAASLARGGRSLADPDSNPISRFLNALNPISRANAAEGEGGGLPPTLLQMLLKGLIDAATAKRLAEQQKILEDAEDAKRELFEVAQGRASSRALGVVLEASGVPRPPGYAAHHIAAGADERGEPARGVLKKFNIGINDVSNGVFLPANRATQVIAGETIHSTLHTERYYDAVNDALAEATTRQEVIAILQSIRVALQSGDYP